MTAKGLLLALPAAIGLIALIPAAVYLQFVLGVHAPSWLSLWSSAVSNVVDAVFHYGPFVGIALIWLAMFLVTAIHEAGHAFAAFFVGWPVLEFRVLPFSIQKHNGNWKLQMNWMASPPGMVLANPRTTRFHSNIRIYALAGPLVNLITAFWVIPFQFGREVTFVSTFPTLVATWSIFFGFLNLIPMHLQGLESDGHVAFVVSRKPKRLAARVAAIRMRQQVLSGKLIEAMNQRWVALAEQVEQASLQSRGGLWLAYSYWLNRDEYKRAALVLEKLLRSSRNADDHFKGMLFAEAAIISVLQKRKSEANVWKERSETFSLSDLIRHRRNSYLAWLNRDVDQALQEARLASISATKLHDKSSGERFIQDWNKWILKLQKERDQVEPVIR